ncbi:putative integral membrane protein [Rivularia sp. PCC 7116]|uniref:mannosyltransferase family protein n=1 Tax=Rivularia sp. PCC 7116 TaxID=373994 RepID=UPI00029EE8FD|nr:mannosyltransferase family protein [Rivularia sp. PCC 7116]AFY53651.1 putative integral membrane protein [Rivularia sp. PCC 7116]
MTKVELLKKKKKDSNINELLFPAVMWFGSRLLIWVVMLGIAPLLQAPDGGIAATFGLEVFNAWDSVQYQNIVSEGYEFINDGKMHNVAFFPLFPLTIKLLINLGFSFEIAGLLVNNLAFLGAIYCVYFWVKSFSSENEARWATAVLAWCPPSMFAGVIYTEGLYLFLSAAAMQAFDRSRYGLTALFGALATATRPTGLALIPALIIACWKQRKPTIAYISSLATATGVLLFSVYCAVTFNEPLAFIEAQKGWRESLGFDWQSWWKMLMQISIGTENWKHGGIKDPVVPLLFALIVVLGYLLWRFRKNISRKFGEAKVDYGFAALILIWWLVAGDPLINTVSVVGSAYLIWKLRNELSPVAATYGLCGLALVLASGGTWSLSRIVYGIVSVSIAFGIFLSRHPRWGYLTMGFFAILLTTFSIRFAQELWVG